MLESVDFRNSHEVAESFLIKGLPVRREHLSQLKRQHVRVSEAHRLINRGLFPSRLSMQASRLKQNWNSTMCNNHVHLLPVEFDDVARLPFDIGPAHKRSIFTQRLPFPTPHVNILLYFQ